MSALDAGCNRMKSKLDVLERVRADLDCEGIEVPGVIVCGEQSSGKSSVLEYVSGISFPRGEGTCTRCPAIVRLECNPRCEAPVAWVGMDADVENKGERITDLDKIADKIKELTERHTENCTRIVEDPIHIKVIRNTGATLTLIDIPGITHVNQSAVQEDIHDVTRGMVEKYIQKESMVVLVVIPAGSDFGNAEALKIALEHDTEGHRTLGVITKADLVLPDSDIVKRIRMEREMDIKLHLGYVAVRCRTPKEVDEGLSFEDAKQREEHLWNKKPYEGLQKEYRGLDRVRSQHEQSLQRLKKAQHAMRTI